MHGMVLLRDADQAGRKRFFPTGETALLALVFITKEEKELEEGRSLSLPVFKSGGTVARNYYFFFAGFVL